MFLAATLGQLLASTCNPMLSAQVFLRLGNHAGKYLPFFFSHPPWFIPLPLAIVYFSALFTGVVPNEHLVLLLLYYAHQL